MNVKCENWPRVLPDDNGIRPAGKPDECFYCHAKVGQLHEEDCCTVTCLNRYEVQAHGRRVGTFDRYDPHFWDAGDCNFHKNGSSWCADNALDAIEWSDLTVRDEAEAMSADSCCCSLLGFEYKETLDAGAFITRPDEPAGEAVCKGKK